MNYRVVKVFKVIKDVKDLSLTYTSSEQKSHHVFMLCCKLHVCRFFKVFNDFKDLKDYSQEIFVN